MSEAYQIDQWMTLRWHTDRRYYVVEVMQDLFGVWMVKRSWGSLSSRAGNSKHMPAGSYEDALAQLETVSKTRLRRGYTPV